MHRQELFKCRDIHLHPLPAEQAAVAARCLDELDGVSTLAHPYQHRLTVTYHLDRHRYVELLGRLAECGFHLDNSLLAKLKTALIDYAESVQCHNLGLPATALKTGPAYARIYDRHRHGDRDDTPEELRRYL